MEHPREDLDSALQSFREEWRAEVRAKQPTRQRSQDPYPDPGRPPVQSPPGPSGSSGPAPTPTTGPVDGNVANNSVAPAVASAGQAVDCIRTQPSSALDIFEDAVDKEARGRLADSLSLYRTAYRMDSKVDQHYRTKHFPAAAQGHSHVPLGSGTSPAVRGQNQPSDDPQPRPFLGSDTSSRGIDALVCGFAHLSIPAAPADVEGTSPPPPCPISQLPDEILLHVLLLVALDDVGDFVRLTRVCRRLAFLVTTEDQIWRRVCLASPHGFNHMTHTFRSSLTWEAAEATAEAAVRGEEDEARRVAEAALRTYRSSWRHMFRLRPRVRFDGIYIATVRYLRQGQASAALGTSWGNNPVHICTYFRYLRFFRDGSCISLLTTAEPTNVVPYMTKELLELHRSVDSPMAHLPSAEMKNARRGRWHLVLPADVVSADPRDGHGIAASATGQPPVSQDGRLGYLAVETEGIGSQYVYKLELVFGSAGKRFNNKLAWKSFHSYNRLTDDWAEFTLRNDKPFFFSRVKRYT